MGKSIVFDKIINECSKNNKIYLDDIKNYKLTDREFDEFLCCLNLKNIELCIGDKENNQDKDVDLYIDDSMDQFLNEIGKYKLLSKEEEVVLFKLYKQGNMNARKQLIESNLRLVVSVAKRRYLRKNENSIQMLDLCQEGTKGLMRAIETFDVDKGCKFSPYATWLIDKKIARYIWENDRTIRIPSGARTKINGIKHFKKEFMQKNNRLPNIQEYMDGLNMKEDQVKIYLEASLDLCSLDATINEEKDISLKDVIQDDQSLENIIIDREIFKLVLEKAKSILSERELDVILRRNGFFNNKVYTLEEIGKEYKVTKQCVNQTETRAYRKLKRVLEEYNIKKYK